MSSHTDNRNKRRETAKQTLDILERGHYRNPRGREVSIRAVQINSVRNSELYRSQDFGNHVHAQAAMQLKERDDRFPGVQIECKAVTTLEACASEVFCQQDLLQGRHKSSNILCLNFASAKNPGGGFLNGSQAQEESLARASGLYSCLLQNDEYYKYHRSHRRDPFYSHYLIYSPNVPVFRDDSDRLLEDFYCVSIITAPAVNSSCLSIDYDHDVRRVMLERTENLLAVAFLKGHRVLVLGAWGCGVFGNDPKDVAGYFAHFLCPGGKYERAFDRIIFAIPEAKGSNKNLKAFQQVFCQKHGDR